MKKSEDKKVDGFTKTEWSAIHREGRWFSDYSQEIYRTYLGVKKFNEIQFSQHTTSFAMSLNLRFRLEDFFLTNQLTVTNIADLEHAGEYSPTYSNIEYESGKTKSCLYRGFYFLEDKNKTKYIVSLEPRNNSVNFGVIARKDSSPSSQTLLDKLILFASENNFLKGKKIDAVGNFIKFDRTYAWDDLILAQETKDLVRKNISNLLSHREVYKQNGLTVKRGLIISGKPGTGKTHLARIICQTSDWTFVWVTPQHLTRGAEDISKIVGLCRDLSPTVLFLEDVDLYGGERGENRNTELLGELMNQLDGVQENQDIMTIATTNRPEVLEKALIDRPGRFDKVIEFKEPDEVARHSLLKYFTKGLHIDKDIDLDILSKLTNGLAGAHIKELVSMSVLNAIDEESFDTKKTLILKKSHFKAALNSVKKKDFSKLGFGIAKSTDPNIRSWIEGCDPDLY